MSPGLGLLDSDRGYGLEFLWSFGVMCQGGRGGQEIENLYTSVAIVSGSFLSHWFCFIGYHRVLCCLLSGHCAMWLSCGNTVDISMDSGDLKVAERLRPGTTNRSKQVSQLSGRSTPWPFLGRFGSLSILEAFYGARFFNQLSHFKRANSDHSSGFQHSAFQKLNTKVIETFVWKEIRNMKTIRIMKNWRRRNSRAAVKKPHPKSRSKFFLDDGRSMMVKVDTCCRTLFILSCVLEKSADKKKTHRQNSTCHQPPAIRTPIQKTSKKPISRRRLETRHYEYLVF